MFRYHSLALIVDTAIDAECWVYEDERMFICLPAGLKVVNDNVRFVGFSQVMLELKLLFFVFFLFLFSSS